MSSEKVSRSPHLIVSSIKSTSGDTGAMSDSLDQSDSNDVESDENDSNSSIDISEIQSGAATVDRARHSLHGVSNVNTTVSEDSNVDVETEGQNTPVSNSLRNIESGQMVSNSEVVFNGTEQDDDDNDSDMSDARYIEKQVVESFLNVNSGEMQAVRDISKETNIPKNMSFSRSESSHFRPTSGHESVMSSGGAGFCLPGSSSASNGKVEKILDAVTMIIAGVAAGEGDPPKFLTRDSPDRHRQEHASHQLNQDSATKYKKVKVERSMPASARLPVISSLLAPSSAAYHQTALPGIQHIASHAKSSNTSRTVLPSVAHFLGPAKSPPIVYTPQKSSTETCGTSYPSTSSADIAASGHPGAHYQTAFIAHTKLNTTPSSSFKTKNSRKQATPAGLRLSMAAAEEFPDPLPVPQYSEKVFRAKQLGTVTFDRPTVLRETVQFFLQFKHYWSSHDYDRISNLVIELFPEFKDGSDAHGVPASKRIRTDLSMYARNFRRREVSQRKREKAGSTPTGLSQKSEDVTDDVTHEADDKSALRSPSPQNSGSGPIVSGSVGNPSDFCNELLTAASIIESQNTAGAGRNGDGYTVMSNNNHKVRVTEPETHGQGPVIQKYEAAEEDDDRLKGVSSSHHKSHDERLDNNEEDDAPLHFVYDKGTMAVATSREANTAWQMYSEQMAQAIAAGNCGIDYGVTDDTQSSIDRLSAMAMWRSTTLPDPLPQPPYSGSIIRARESGNTMSARPKIIRETTQFFLALKLWWTAPDYDRIAELVLHNFPALVSLQAIKKDLGTCARNMRRRLPSTTYKPASSSQKSWNNLHTGLELQNSDISGTSLVPGTAEYMKALMAAQNMNLTELGMTQRNLGELAVLAGIKQRIEQHPQEVTSLERQYLAQCSSEEQRQALMASGAFGHDTAAVAALSAFYGLGIDIGSSKRGLVPYEYTSASTLDASSLAGGELDAPNKRQRRISQAEVEDRLQEAELNHDSLHHEEKSHGISVAVSDIHMVKREPMSPIGESLKTSSIKHHYQQLSVPSTSAYPSGSSSSAHNPAYWDGHAVADMGMAYSVPHQTATQAHSQAQIQHLPGHDPSAHPSSVEAPMNLTYSESERHVSHKVNVNSPLPESLPDTAGLAAQVEVTTSTKSHSPRKRASSSPRFSHSGEQALISKDQMWFPHGTGFKKESQEVVSLPEPLPVPNYSQKILNARDESSSMRHRSEIIRETARFFLTLKYWWSSVDYTRISELVVQQFPDLKEETTPDGITSYRRIQRDLSMCARNLRRSKKPRRMREFASGSTSTLLDVPKTPHASKKQAETLKSSSSYSSSTEKKLKKSSGASFKSKKLKQEPAGAAVSDELLTGVPEELAAATALLQHQFMQSSSPYHPSAHLLPSSHLLPSLHTHPALHDQQMQQHHHNQEHQESHNISVEDPRSAKRLVKEESDIDESEDQCQLSEKSSTTDPVQRSASTTVDEGHAARSKPDHGHMKEEDGAVLSESDQDKVTQQPYHQPPTNYMKVYADPEHGCDLQEKFSTLWRKGKFFDASLGVANKKLHVHKLILLAMSPYLQETFKNADPRSQLEVNLPSDTTYETAKAFLKYIYEGVLEVDTSSVRSLHKIATMLQMTKLAQYCQDFAQHLQEEAEKASRIGGGEEGEIPKISVNLGEMQAQRQKHLEAQALQRLGETTSISSTDLHRTSANHYMSDEHAQLKEEYLTSSGDQAAMDQSGSTSHFLHPDILAQHRALMAASSSVQSSSSSSLLFSSSQDVVATQQLLQTALARHQTSSLPHSSAYVHHQQHAVSQTNTKASLLHRLTSPDSSVIASGPSSLDHQQRLALAAYWQAHTLGELMSRNQVTGLTSDPSALTSASELAAATTSEDTHHMLSNLGHDPKMKNPHSGGHHSKEATWAGHSGDSSNGHHVTMLPETCIPADMARTHVHSSD